MNERFEVHLNSDILALIQAAASLSGQTVSDFIATAALEAANKIIEEHNIIRLSVEDQRRFAETLINPPELSPAMLRAEEAHKLLIIESN